MLCIESLTESVKLFKMECVWVITSTEHVWNAITDNGVSTHAVFKVSNSDEENEHQMDGTTVKRHHRYSKFSNHCI